MKTLILDRRALALSEYCWPVTDAIIDLELGLGSLSKSHFREEILGLMLEGYSQIEASEILHTSRRRIVREIARIKDILKEIDKSPEVKRSPRIERKNKVNKSKESRNGKSSTDASKTGKTKKARSHS
jgi:hypothetical protein